MGWDDLVLLEVVLLSKPEFWKWNPLTCSVRTLSRWPRKKFGVIVELRQAGPMKCSALIGLGENILCNFEWLDWGESFDAGLLEGVS